MQIDPEELKRHYALLSDEALLDIDAADLTDTARMCYQGEMAHRKLTPGAEAQPDAREAQVETESPGTTAVVGTFQYPEEFAEARDVLENAGIPCSIRSSRHRFELIVPVSLRQQAEQTLRKQYFDPESEIDYQNHFELLSDEELLALQTDSLSEAARKLWGEEVTLRGLEETERAVRPHQMTDTANLQLVGTFVSVEEAQLAQGLLESASIPCSLENTGTPGWSEELRLVVAAEFYNEACEIIEAGLSNEGGEK